MKKSGILLVITFALLGLSGCNEKSESGVQPVAQSVMPSDTLYTFTAIGQTLQLTAKVSPSQVTNPFVQWQSSNTSVATVSDNGLVTCVGLGNSIITVTADGVSNECNIYAVEIGSVRDVCGNTYRTVKIGTQWWMAENMRCDTYDTESERAGVILSKYNIQHSFNYYSEYIDGRNAISYFTIDSNTKTSDQLTSEQRNMLGYLYNWPVTVGFSTHEEYMKQTPNPDFNGNRQGICPNGWHVPTSTEWCVLADYVGSGGGRLLKSSSGWFSNNGNGIDAYCFNALPAGNAHYNKGDFHTYNVGLYADFWTATMYRVETAIYGPYFRQLDFDNGEINSCYVNVYDLFSVRCVKN
jgi:uncharacterized protein (TIGR02145 family)